MSEKDQKYLSKIMGGTLAVGREEADTRVDETVYEEAQTNLQQANQKIQDLTLEVAEVKKNETERNGQLRDLMQIINAMKLGVQITKDPDDGTLYFGKGVGDGSHFIVIKSEADGGGYLYAYSNNKDQKSKVEPYTSVKSAIEYFQIQITKEK